MAKAQPEEIQLPWRPTVDGAVAELGAIFRVELVGGDWRCSVKSGRCQTIIAKGLKTQTEGKRRAQAHAATMPEVRAAENDEVDAKPGAKKPAAPRRSRKTRQESHAGQVAAAEPAAPPAAAPPPATTTPAITFQETEDGCLCGKTQGVCWVASEKEVALARPLPEPVKDQIAAAVAQYYAAKRATSEPAATPTAARKTTRAAAKKTAKAAARKTAKAAAKKTAKKTAKAAAKKTAKVAAKKQAKKPAREEKPAPETPKNGGPANGRKAGRGRGKKAARGKRAEPKEEAPMNGKAKDADATAAPATATLRGKRAGTEATATGPITWSEVEGKPRGTAAHGTFLIEPEGQGFGLYFADPSGQSRHLRSGTLPELRRAAEEYAARGEPAPLRDAPSREQDEALMRIFASGAVEGG